MLFAVAVAVVVAAVVVVVVVVVVAVVVVVSWLLIAPSATLNYIRALLIWGKTLHMAPTKEGSMLQYIGQVSV